MTTKISVYTAIEFTVNSKRNSQQLQQSVQPATKRGLEPLIQIENKALKGPTITIKMD
jgi:hypothetical protein